MTNPRRLRRIAGGSDQNSAAINARLTVSASILLARSYSTKNGGRWLRLAEAHWPEPFLSILLVSIQVMSSRANRLSVSQAFRLGRNCLHAECRFTLRKIMVAEWTTCSRQLQSVRFFDDFWSQEAALVHSDSEYNRLTAWRVVCSL